MLDEMQIDKRGVHRRRNAGVRRLNKRGPGFTPTAVFTPFPSDTDTPADTATQPPAASNTTTTPAGILLPPTTTTSQPTTDVATTSNPADTTTTPAQPTTTSTSDAPPTTTTDTPPTTTLQQTTQAQVTTPIQTPKASRTLADAITEVTQTLTSTRSGDAAAASSLAASPTSSTTPNPGTSTGVVIGGIVAAIIGVAGILFAVVYFIRRSRNNEESDDGNDFNAQAFRRQSVALHDDGGPAMARAATLNRGGSGTPRPPTMIERKMANTPISYNAPPVPHPYGYATAYGQASGAYGQPSFSPGQIMTPGPYTPTTVNSANPFFSPYGESPIGSPVSVAPYDSAYNAQGQPINRQLSNGSSSSAVLSRQPSSAAQPSVQAAPEPEYVDLSRSSVTPFQAAQYAEISRRLNTTPPAALPASDVAEVAEELAEYNEPPPIPQKSVEPLELQPAISFDEQRLTVQPTPREHSFPESPFADPTLSFHEEQIQHQPERDSLPQPPSPTFSSKSRVTSTPPTLPEIQIQQRPFSPVSLDFPAVPSSPHPVPSPLGSTFSMPSPPPSAHLPDNVASATAAPIPRAQPPAANKRPDTVYTLYDEEDAYAGI